MSESTTVEMISQHVASEELAARTYRYLASWCGVNGYDGSEAYFLAESADESRHMSEWQSYTIDRWEDTTPPPIGEQGEIEHEIGRLCDCYEFALTLEKTVLDQINQIGQSAMVEGDIDVIRFLQPYTQVGIASIRELTSIVQQLDQLDDGHVVLWDQERTEG
jgi:ferritin